MSLAVALCATTALAAETTGLPEAFDAGWFTTEVTVHEALNVGDTTTSYLIVEPKPE